MQKKKIFDIASSNIAMLGSDVEKKCKQAAGKGEEAWKGAGKKEGLEIWRIEQFKVKAWPKERYGEFFVGDSYIILYTYKKDKDQPKLSWKIHFWLGSSTSHDEAGTAAYKTVELDDQLGGGPVQYREVCGKETGCFLDYFSKNGGVTLLSGGAKSGFNKVEPTKYEPRLLHIKGRRNPRVVQVELECKSLCDGDCFILDDGLTIYQWQGKSANLKEKVRAAQYAANLDAERKGKPEIVVIDQGDKDVPQKFWQLLGGKEKIRIDSSPDAAWEKSSGRRMFQLSDAGGTMEFNIIGEGRALSSKKLISEDVFIVDVGSQVYIWVGSGSSKQEKTKAMTYAQQYLKDYKRPSCTPLIRIAEGNEPEEFTQALSKKGIRRFKKSTGGPKVEQKGNMVCYLTWEETSNGSLFLNWSENGVNDEKSLAYFTPQKAVPKYKFKTKGGKDECTRGTNSDKKNLYQAWCNFVKLAKEYNGQVYYSCGGTALYQFTGGKLSELKRKEMIEISGIKVIAAIPRERAGCFDGLKGINQGSFLGIAQKNGAALTL